MMPRNRALEVALGAHRNVEVVNSYDLSYRAKAPFASE
jgi:hypothetical protein